jgi:protein SCO1
VNNRKRGETSLCRTRWLLPAVALAFGIASSAALARNPPDAAALDANAALERSQRALGNPVGDHAFTAADGRRVRLSEFRGKPLLVSFVYTACSQVCPTTTRFLNRAVREADRALGPGRFRVITIGFNLPYDTPAAMQGFQRQQGIERAGWEFLSPDPGVVEVLTREMGFSFAASAGGFDHLAQVTLLDAEGRVATQVYGEDFDLAMLVGPLKNLLTGAPIERPSVADIVERVRLLCTVYDPRTGRYRLDYTIVVEILAGSSILLAVLYFLLREWWRNRRRLRAA